MLHVSFAMTAEAYADGTKTETRRFWKPRHAAKFKPGVEFMGITKDFRAGGERIHPARVVFCKPERLANMSNDSFIREGGTRYWRDRRDYINTMGGTDLIPYVLRFEHLIEIKEIKVGTYHNTHTDMVFFHRLQPYLDVGALSLLDGNLFTYKGHENWDEELLAKVAWAYRRRFGLNPPPDEYLVLQLDGVGDYAKKQPGLKGI